MDHNIIISTNTTTTTHEDTHNNNITHDFMSTVESFSQLPFIRPPPPPPLKLDKPIRLFGIEFSPDRQDNHHHHHLINTEPNMINSNNVDVKHQEPPSTIHPDSTTNGATAAGETTTGSSNRKFECHYCCRNFPTSQALGGHQNAHKRERQHAKRAHLHPAAAAAILHGAIGPWPPSPASSSLPYPSARFYENHHHGSYLYSHPPPPTINGSPMGLWRINPTVQASSFNRDRPLVHSIPASNLFTDVTDHHHQSFKPRPGPAPPQSLMVSPPPRRYFYDSKPAVVQDHHVSLDLHL